MRVGQSLLQDTAIRRIALGVAAVSALLLIVQLSIPLLLPRGIESVSRAWTADVSIEEASLRLMRLYPTLELRGVSLGIDGDTPVFRKGEIAVSISWWRFLTGEWVANEITVDRGNIALVVDADGESNVPSMVAALLELSSNDGSDPPVSSVSVNNVSIGYAYQPLDQFGLFKLSGQANLDEVHESTLFMAKGVVNGQDVVAELGARFIGSDALMKARVDARLRIQIADLVVQLNTSIAQIESLLPFDAELNVSGDSLGVVLNALNIVTEPLKGSTEVAAVAHITEDIFHLKKITAKIGRSSAKADATVTWAGQRPRIEARLHIENLAVDDFHFSGSEPEVSENGESNRLSDYPFAFHDTLLAIDGSLELSAERIQRGGITVTDFSLDGVLEHGVFEMDFVSNNLANGELNGVFDYQVDDSGKGAGSLRMDVRQIQVNEIASNTLMVEIMPSGTLTLAVDLEFNGASVAGIASSLEGGIYLFVEDGQLDELAVELMGADFLETARLLVIRDLQQIDVSCGFIGIDANSGVLELNPFVIDSEDTVFVAIGTVDLNTESLDLTFQSHARDTSWFTAATPVHVRGTLANPKVRAGRKLYSRLAAAAALATVAAPAAMLLPFIELGESVDTSECESRLLTLR